MAGRGRRSADALLITALLAGETLGDAAKRAGVGEQTVRRRLREPAFRNQLNTMTDELLSATIASLTSASVEAVQVLRTLFTEGPPTVRLGAARAVLEATPRWRENSVELRLSALEAALAEREGSKP